MYNRLKYHDPYVVCLDVVAFIMCSGKS